MIYNHLFHIDWLKLLPDMEYDNNTDNTDNGKIIKEYLLK